MLEIELLLLRVRNRRPEVKSWEAKISWLQGPLPSSAPTSSQPPRLQEGATYLPGPQTKALASGLCLPGDGQRLPAEATTSGSDCGLMGLLSLLPAALSPPGWGLAPEVQGMCKALALGSDCLDSQPSSALASSMTLGKLLTLSSHFLHL